MLDSGRAGFRREFLEINGIDRHHITRTIRASPQNEGFREIIPAVPRVPSIAEKMVPSNERIYKGADSRYEQGVWVMISSCTARKLIGFSNTSSKPPARKRCCC